MLQEENNKQFFEIILNNVQPYWKLMWIEIFNSEEGKLLLENLQKKICNELILPKNDLILQTFKFFDLHETKLVFLGQDPYINIELVKNIPTPQAMGLSFSVPVGIKIPPSLKNIFKEIKNCYPNFKVPIHGDLTRWVKDEKILLLNSALTVEKGVSNSHQHMWENLTDEVIKYISINHSNVIFLLLGNYAKSKKKFIDLNKHEIISQVHPSPLSAHRGFFNSNIFKNINIKLESSGKKKINWEI